MHGKDIRMWRNEATNYPEIPYNTPIGQAFKKEMEGCRYGPDETWEAWCWFTAGWESCERFRDGGA